MFYHARSIPSDQLEWGIRFWFQLWVQTYDFLLCICTRHGTQQLFIFRTYFGYIIRRKRLLYTIIQDIGNWYLLIGIVFERLWCQNTTIMCNRVLSQWDTVLCKPHISLGNVFNRNRHVWQMISFLSLCIQMWLIRGAILCDTICR